MCDRVVPEDPFSIVYCPDKYKTQRMCEEAVDDSLAAWKIIPNIFITSKMIKKLFTAMSQKIIYSNLMKILVMSYFLVMKWLFSV